MLFFFFFNDTATTEIYTLSLHDALPILLGLAGDDPHRLPVQARKGGDHLGREELLQLEERVRVDQLAERSEEHTSELQSQSNLVCRLLLEKKKDDEYNQ